MISDNTLLYKCFLGSRTRSRIIVSLRQHGEMHATMLAAACRTNASMIEGAMEGAEPYFSTELALRRLGLVSRRKREGAWAYRLTQAGEASVSLANAARRDELYEIRRI